MAFLSIGPRILQSIKPYCFEPNIKRPFDVIHRMITHMTNFIRFEFCDRHSFFKHFGTRLTVIDHFFETGEKIIYTPGSTFTGATVTGIATAGGTLSAGTELFAIKNTQNKDRFKVSKSRADALAGINLIFTSAGAGNYHEFEMFKKNEKALMSIDGVIQSPMAFTPITTELEYNITNSAVTFSLTGISSITSDDVIKVNDEFMKITNVGLGTTNAGPITETGSVKLIEVERGAIGSASTNHSLGDTVRLFLSLIHI